MRKGQKANSILNSPIVRSFIKPVRVVVPSPLASSPLPSSSTAAPPTASTSTALPTVAKGNPYLAHWQDEPPVPPASAPAEEKEQQEDEVREEGPWMIPTQPVSAEGEKEESEVVKGKKRARQEDEEDQPEVLEYDEASGMRFGEKVRWAEGEVPEDLEKYWAQRYRLFSLFDDGCEMDREGWYSVTPENIAAQIAERCRCGVIVDAFCGVGGNAIQFAFTCERVIALDTSPVRLACARRNAEIYGVADRITFILGDWVQWAKDYAAREERGELKKEDKVEVVFLSPPWGGIDYQTLGAPSSTSTAAAQPAAKKPRRSLLAASGPAPSTPTPSVPPPSLDAANRAAPPPAYPLSALAPLHGADLFSLARRITPNVAYYLPRNTDLLELAALPKVAPWKGRPRLRAGEAVEGEAEDEETVEVEEEWMGYKLKAITAYFGELAVGAGWVEQE
ncbi:hypothetical protein JCM8097_005242 [Rhodosporidiobolus ruineniae]